MALLMLLHVVAVHTQKEISLTRVQHALFIRQTTESKVVTHDNRRAGKQKIQLTIFFLLNFPSSPLLPICKIGMKRALYCTKCTQGSDTVVWHGRPLTQNVRERGLVISLYQSCSIGMQLWARDSSGKPRWQWQL